MFERFTDRARKVMALANQEAQRLGHEYIGTEHILAGLLLEGSGVGANVLKNLDVDLERLQHEIKKLLRASSTVAQVGKLPQTPGAKKVIEYAIEEARGLGHNYVGTEHLVLGLLREQDGLAAQALANLGIRLDAVRKETRDLLGSDSNDSGEQSVDKLLLDAANSLAMAAGRAATEGNPTRVAQIQEIMSRLTALLGPNPRP